jgi:hypothetical protein
MPNIELTQNDYELLLLAMGQATGAASRDGNKELARAYVRLTNSLFRDLPGFRQYRMHPGVALFLSRSQQMALIDIVLSYARIANQPQEFVDCTTAEAVTTTTGDLLTLVSSMPGDSECVARPGEQESQ